MELLHVINVMIKLATLQARSAQVPDLGLGFYLVCVRFGCLPECWMLNAECWIQRAQWPGVFLKKRWLYYKRCTSNAIKQYHQYIEKPTREARSSSTNFEGQAWGCTATWPVICTQWWAVAAPSANCGKGEGTQGLPIPVKRDPHQNHPPACCLRRLVAWEQQLCGHAPIGLLPPRPREKSGLARNQSLSDSTVWPGAGCGPCFVGKSLHIKTLSHRKAAMSSLSTPSQGVTCSLLARKEKLQHEELPVGNEAVILERRWSLAWDYEGRFVENMVYSKQ